MGRAKDKARCGQCGHDLIKGRCRNQECDAHVSGGSGVDRDTLLHILAAMAKDGTCYYHAPSESVVLAGVRADQVISCNAPTQMALQFLLDRVIDITGRPDREITPALGRRLLTTARELDEESAILPYVTSVGRWPVLQYGEMKWDRPCWPDISKSSRLRYLQKGYFYKGPVVVPKQTGAFERWLATVRCVDDENRQTLREWLLGTILVNWFDPGSAPALLLCATKSGIGKTETAKAIGALLGGFVEVDWTHVPTADSLHRRIMADCNRMVLIDNLSPKTTSRSLMDFSELASLITRGALSVKTLFKTTGNTAQPNVYSYVITANLPLLTPELLNRCAVVTLGDSVERVPGWLQGTVARRDQIMADMLHIAISNWNAPEQRLIDDIRYDSWARAVGCVTGQEPKLQRGRSALIQPWDWLISRLWVNPMSTREPLVDLLMYLRDPKVQGRYQAVLAQEEPTYEVVKQKLMWTTRDYYLETVDGKDFVVRRVSGAGPLGAAAGAKEEGKGKEQTRDGAGAEVQPPEAGEAQIGADAGEGPAPQ